MERTAIAGRTKLETDQSEDTCMDRISLSGLHAYVAPPRLGRLGSMGARMATWLAACADYYDAAAQYEQLSKFSDAELHRRGLSRDTLARDICAACDRSGQSP